ncbi:MAG: hypothetical protein E2O39_02730 [Planctomycetota bacterium]|nr:MAG: hypothetical protein E2O39_02730 [Planctomycetota bacterium]
MGASPTTASIAAIGSQDLHNLAWDDATQLLWSVDLGTDVLVTIDPADGTTTFIGDTGLNLVHGLAIDPSDGTIYALRSSPVGTSSELWILDRATAQPTLVGAVGFAALSALDFDPTTGALWAAYASNVQHLGILVTIDPQTAAGTFIVPTQRLTGMAFDATGALYGVDNNLSNYVETSVYFINTSTGVASFLGNTTSNNIGGLAFGGPSATATYCTTSPHSGGSGARIDRLGSTSLAHDDLVLVATDSPPNQNGIFFYGPNQTQVPVGDGQLCVAGQIGRLPVVDTGTAGRAEWPFDYGNPPTAATQVLPGSTWNFQFWFCDPLGPGGSGFNLSDGMAAMFLP